jgi:MFS family permease
MNRNVWLLFTCQAMVNAAGICQVAMSALIGYSLSPEKGLATLPYALQMIGTMAAAIPASMLFARLGRRVGFVVGALSMLGGTLVLLLGVWRADFVIYCIGALPLGVGFGIGQHYRFAASEVAAPQARARAIALVMAGGVVSAILGPEIVKHTKSFLEPVLFSGTYIALLLLPLISLVLIAFIDLPPAPKRVVKPVPLSVLVARPAFVTAVIAGLVGYGTMNLIMTATPLQMMLCGFGVDQSTDVIRIHAICMFAPGFFTGSLIQRFGAHRVIMAGGAFCLACAGMSLAPPVEVNFMLALGLLGLGWNFMFVGATALLSSAHDAAERVRAQAANDFVIFSTVAAASVTSGLLQHFSGWVVLNATVVLPVLIAVGLVWWHRANHVRQAAVA